MTPDSQRGPAREHRLSLAHGAAAAQTDGAALCVATGIVGTVRASRRPGTLVLDAMDDQGTTIHMEGPADGFVLPPEGIAYWRASLGFEAEGETYGSVSFTVAARDEDEAAELARSLAEISRYDDDRIPDRSVSVEVEELPEFLDDLAAEQAASGPGV